MIIEWALLLRLRPFNGNTEKELYGSEDHNNKVEHFLYHWIFFFMISMFAVINPRMNANYSFWLKFWCSQTRVTNFLSGRWPCLATLEATNSFPEGSLFVEREVTLKMFSRLLEQTKDAMSKGYLLRCRSLSIPQKEEILELSFYW